MIKGNLTPLLYVKSVPRSIEFYRDVLGFSSVRYWDDREKRYVTNWSASEQPTFAELSAGNLVLYLHAAGEDVDDGPAGGVVLHVEVDDADAYHARVQDAGGQTERPRDHVWGWRQFFVSDPDGHRWAFHHVIA